LKNFKKASAASIEEGVKPLEGRRSEQGFIGHVKNEYSIKMEDLVHQYFRATLCFLCAFITTFKIQNIKSGGYLLKLQDLATLGLHFYM
jgi:hypothetical protein